MHGVISQISSRIQVASTGHSRELKSVVGDFEFLQLNPKYFNCGIEWTTHQHPYAMACPEKALLDCLYISSKKGKRFRHFSELDLNYLNPSKFKKILKEHNFNISVENYLLERFNHLLQKNKQNKEDPIDYRKDVDRFQIKIEEQKAVEGVARNKLHHVQCSHNRLTNPSEQYNKE